MSYKVKLDIFEGPFDLLVYLIESAHMSIYDIKVAEITTQYMEYIEEMKRQDVAVAADFMVLASELIQIKSAMLLPRGDADGDLADPEDPRQSLVARILEYKIFKEAAAFLSDQEEAMQHVHTKPAEDLSIYVGEADELLKADMEDFARAFSAFLLKKQRLQEIKKNYERVERERMSLEDCISNIRKNIEPSGRVMFSQLVEDTDISTLVVTFIAILELVRQRSLRVIQAKPYSDIEIVLTGQINELSAEGVGPWTAKSSSDPTIVAE